MKMPPTGIGAGNGRSHNNLTHITSRPRRASRVCLDYAALASLGKIVETPHKKIAPHCHNVRSAGQINLIPCKVVLKRLSLTNLHLGGRLDIVDVNQPGTSAKRTSSRTKSTLPSELDPPERFSNVTKRTKPRRTEGEAVKLKKSADAKQRHTISIIDESHGSIITLDESTDGSRVVARQRRHTQQSTSEHGPPPVRRGTTHNKNTTSDVVEMDKELEVQSSAVEKKKRGRPPLKRKSEPVGPPCSAGVSPPQKAPEGPVSIIELSMAADEGTVEANGQPAVHSTEPPPAVGGSAVVSNQTTSKKHLNNPFQAVIVSVKRIVPALTEAAVKKLKFPEPEAAPQEAKGSSVHQSNAKAKRQPSRLTVSTKPQIVLSAPLAEDPELAEPEELQRNAKCPATRQPSRLAVSTKPQIVVSAPLAEVPALDEPEELQRNAKRPATRQPSRLAVSTKPQIVVSAPLAEDPELAEPEELQRNAKRPATRQPSRLAVSTKPQIVVSAPLEEDPALAEPEELQRNAKCPATRQPSRLAVSTKPQIVVSAPLAEDPESIPEPDPPRPKVDANANNLVRPGAAGKRGGALKQKPPLSSLPRLIEEEDEGSNGDVYEFLSLSQTSGEGVVSRKKRGRKPTQKREKGKAKPAAPKAAKRKVGHNPFGCNRRQIAKAIKQIGGGPVKSPAPNTGGYVVNLDLPKTPGEPSSYAAQRTIIEVADIPFEAAVPPSVPLRATNPAVERLKNGSSVVLPNTSTPINKPALVATKETPPHNPASPWRLQDDAIVPRTTYMPRNKDMLPSYESLASGTEDIPPKTSSIVPPSLVTERRKPPAPQSTSSVDSYSSFSATPVRTSGVADFPGGIVSEKHFREIERMNGELEATSELSRNLINSMRRYKATVANNPNAAREYESNMRGACVKLRQWYERSMKSLNRSIHIMNRIHRAAGHPSIGLSTDQQRTVDTLSHSTDMFRTVIDELEVAMNDSNLENRSPPSASTVAGKTKPTPLQQAKLPHQPNPQLADVILLPNRTNGRPRNPLMALNFVPLPQRTSPLMSPLAKTDGAVPVAKAAIVLPDPGRNIRRELQYDRTAKDTQETMASASVTSVEPPGVPSEPNESLSTELVPEVGANVEVMEVCDETTTDNDLERSNEQPDDDDATSHHQETADLERSNEQPDDDDATSHHQETAAGGQGKDFFGFDDDSYVESSQLPRAQVTLPMPLNISTETLKRRLQRTKALLPKGPVFRKEPSGRSSGPTRLPISHLRVFGSPSSKRPHTLREFIASTPRSEMSLLAVPTKGGPQVSSRGTTSPPLEAPDVSAIESNNTVVVEEPTIDPISAVPEVVLFGTPDESKINRSAHQRTYSRMPRRKKKINIFLAAQGLDDDDDDEDEDDQVVLSSDSDGTTEAKRRKKKAPKKRPRRKPVEETKEFKEFVEEFNSMCEEVERFEVIIE